MPGIQTDPVAGNIENTLVAQAITLSLNLNIGENDFLPNLTLPAGQDYMITAEAEVCYDFEAMPVYGTEEWYPIPQIVTTYLNDVGSTYTPTVEGLLALANDAISDVWEPTEEGDPTLHDIANALGTINNGFDDCRVILGWGVYEEPEKNLVVPTEIPDETKLSVYPNPFIQTTNFQIVPAVDARATLELYDIYGRLVETLFEARVEAGMIYEVKYHRTSSMDAMLIYRLTIGDKVVTGKLLKSNY
jgi:hypothetical protein